MTARAQKVIMEFRCDQNIDKMSIGVDGKRFCEMCQKSLIDFRTKSLKEVLDYTEENSCCGIFKNEHVEPDVVYKLSLSGVKKYFLAFGTFLFTETAYSQITIDSAKQTTEMVDSAKSFKIGESIRKEGINLEKQKSSSKETKSFKRREYEYGIFFYRRFPFVLFRRNVYTSGIPANLW